MGISYVLEDLRYPDYIRNHQVFRDLSKLHKVFPHIGLPNASEECAFSNKEASTFATQLLVTDLYCKVLAVKAPPANLTRALHLVRNHIASYHPQMIMEEEGKWVIRFHTDIDDAPAFSVKKGESFFKGYHKLLTLCKEGGVELPALDTLPNFKHFSSANVPGKKLRVVFSSTGKEGAWDLATISMRGISSCQTWKGPHSHGLIGTISSPIVGVIYITAGTEMEHGVSMIRRSLVRFCIHKTEKGNSALLVDRIYPADDMEARKVFREYLSKKSKLPVYFWDEPALNNYQLPQDTIARKIPFATPELSYMDHKMPYKPGQNLLGLNREQAVGVWQIIQGDLRADFHREIMRAADEYCATDAHAEFFDTNLINLLLYWRLLFGGNYYASNYLPGIPSYFGDNCPPFQVPPFAGFSTTKAYEKAVLKCLFLQVPFLVQQTQVGTRGLPVSWNYPTALLKFQTLLQSQLKKSLLNLYKRAC